MPDSLYSRAAFARALALVFAVVATPLPFVQAQLLSFDQPVSLAFGDLDSDGDNDLVVGLENSQLFVYYENIGSAQAAAFEERTGPANPFDGLAGRNPRLADLDADGDLDFVFGANYYENVGSVLEPAFEERTGPDNPFASPPILSPTLADLDGDGDLDAVTSGSFGSFKFFENTGTPSSASFVQRTEEENPLWGQDVGPTACCSYPTLADVDGDGDIDLVSGKSTYVEATDGIQFFENTGGSAAVSFVQRVAAENPFSGLSVGQGSGAAFADLNGDGLVEIVVGDATGTVTTPTGVGVVRPARTSSEIYSSGPYPNPFRDKTTLHIRADAPQKLKVVVYDVLGRQVAVMIDGPGFDGNRWDLHFSSASLSSGIYFVRVSGPTRTLVRRMTLIR